MTEDRALLPQTKRPRTKINVGASPTLAAMPNLLKRDQEPLEESGRALWLPLERITPDAEQIRTTLKLTPEMVLEARAKALESEEDGSPGYFDALRELEPPCPDGSRKKDVWPNLVSLAQSIRKHWLIQPIVVSEQGRQYTIIAGERRFLASYLSGTQTIWSVVRPGRPPELKLRVVQWTENAQRSDLTLTEIIDFVRDVARLCSEENGQPIDIVFLQTELNLSKSHAYRYLAIALADEERIEKLFEFIASKQITSVKEAAAWLNAQPKERKTRGSGASKSFKLGKIENPVAVTHLLVVLRNALKDAKLSKEQKRAIEGLGETDLSTAKEQRKAFDLITEIWNEAFSSDRP